MLSKLLAKVHPLFVFSLSAIAVVLSQSGCSRDSTVKVDLAAPAVEEKKDVGQAVVPTEKTTPKEEWWAKTGHPRGQWWLTYPGYEPAAAEKIWETVPIPPSPVLSADEALGTFRMPDGLKIEIVATEPLILRPVFMKFDAAGRLWVVEMPGYMRDIDGKDESEASGRVVVLEDLDGDGRMDKATTFLDGLVMPRTLAFVEGGVLVSEPPRLWYARDLDGDLISDEKTLVASDYGVADNPEHSANGLLPALDNWMYSAKSATRYRFIDGALKSEPTHFRGQWGITQDDTGRLYYNYNASPLHTELVPGHYMVGSEGMDVTRSRNMVTGKTPVSLAIAKDPTLYPSRVTPLVTLGASDLRPDGTLKKFSAACAPLIYRGALLGADYQGSAFVCDPVGNLVARFVLKDDGPGVVAERAYADREFLTSTDERFRPVALENGPDGALYLADMYTGIVEHKRYVTDYLRKQVLSRNIGEFSPTGRIYRIVPETAVRPKVVNLAGKTSAELVEALNSDNGWVRDNAQRLLVERRDPASFGLLRRAAVEGASPLARLHALWACEGVDAVDFATIRHAMGDADVRVRTAAIRISEMFFAMDSASVAEAFRSLAGETEEEVKLQMILSLSRTHESWAAEQLVDLLWKPDAWWYPTVVASAFNGREIELYQMLLKNERWATADPSRVLVIRQLGMSMIQHQQAGRVERFLDLLAEHSRDDWRVGAALAGASALKHAGPPVRLTSPSTLVEKLAASNDPNDKRMAETLLTRVQWGEIREQKVPALTEAEKALFEVGRAAYAATCAACHQPSGQGLQGVAPSLVGSPWVIKESSIPASIVLQGLSGVIEVHGEKWNLAMPGLGSLYNDEQVAGILTYIRRQWGNEASAVSVAEVAAHRQATSSRQTLWTAEELLQMATSKPKGDGQ